MEPKKYPAPSKRSTLSYVFTKPRTEEEIRESMGLGKENLYNEVMCLSNKVLLEKDWNKDVSANDKSALGLLIEAGRKAQITLDQVNRNQDRRQVEEGKN